MKCSFIGGTSRYWIMPFIALALALPLAAAAEEVPASKGAKKPVVVHTLASKSQSQQVLVNKTQSQEPQVNPQAAAQAKVARIGDEAAKGNFESDAGDTYVPHTDITVDDYSSAPDHSVRHGLVDPLVNEVYTPPASGSDVLTVNFFGALKSAIDNSPELEKARASMEKARYVTEEAYTGGSPTLDFGLTYIHTLPENKMNMGGATIRTGYQHNYQAALTLTQAIATFGRLHYAVLAAQLSEKVYQEQYRQAVESKLAVTAAHYISCLLAADSVDICNLLLEARLSSLKDAENLYNAGTSAKFDVLRVRSEATQARQNLIEARNLLNLAKARLCKDMGLPQGTEFSIDPVDMKDVPHDLASQINLNEAAVEAITRRPEVTALDWSIQAAEATVNQIDATNNPTLALQSSVANTRSTSMSSGTSWVTNIALNVPILDGGLERARKGQAMQVVRELEATSEETRRSVRLDVEQSFYNLSSSWERISQAKVGLEQATEADRVARVRYAAGLSTSTEVLDAQSALASAREALATATYGYLSSIVEWVRAISGRYPIQVEGMQDTREFKDQPAWFYVFNPNRDIINLPVRDTGAQGDNLKGDSVKGDNAQGGNADDNAKSDNSKGES